MLKPMRFALAGLLLLLAPMGLARDNAIRAIIQDQLEAFQTNDLDRAFSYASPMIKGMFGNPTRFGQMVRDGYPMVWRPANVHFGGVRELGEGRVQTVFFTDQSGAVFEATYEMIRIDDAWQINGVVIRKADLGA